MPIITQRIVCCLVNEFHRGAESSRLCGPREGIIILHKVDELSIRVNEAELLAALDVVSNPKRDIILDLVAEICTCYFYSDQS